jgi:hypothetical protein
MKDEVLFFLKSLTELNDTQRTPFVKEFMDPIISKS